MADLRIALVQRFLPGTSPGGVGHFTDGLARALIRRGHHVTIYSQDPAPVDAPYAVTRVPVAAGRLAPLQFPWALRRCTWTDVDVIHAQGDEQWIRHRGHPPVVRTMHGTALAEAWFNGVRGRSVTRFLLHLWFFVCESMAAIRADALVGVSAHTLRFSPRRGVVIPNGIDVAALAPRGAVKSAHPTVLFIGEVDSRKRGRFLIETMALVRRTVPTAQLWLVGPETGALDGCRSWGRVDDVTLRTLLQQAWVMCLPSAYEGFGRPYVEAMAAGTAVVASPNPGAREVLQDGALGVIAGDADLASALVRLLTTPAARADLERAGLAAVDRYDWDVVAAQYERVYEGVIARGRR